MALEIMTDDVEIIQNLGTFPNQEDGLTADELKAKFDAGAAAIKKYLNEQLVPTVQSLEENIEPLKGIDPDAMQDAAARAEAAAATFETDTTLSSEGKAADAAATGDALNGKAPAGYGLGKIAVKDWANVDSVKASGWYTFYSDVSIDGHAFGAAVMRADRLDNNMLIQTVYPACDSMTELKRMCLGGEWQPWEWKNPPMNLNSEYRTTERFLGKPVYTMALSAGQLPDTATKSIALPVEFDSLISAEWTIYGNGEYNTMPIYSDGAAVCYWWAEGTNIVIKSTDSYASASTATVIIKYTKD